MKNTLASLAALVILSTPGSVLAGDNTGTGGTITYTDSNGNIVGAPIVGGDVIHTFTSSGTSDAQRITYQAARGEAVSLAGTWRFRLDPKAEGLPAGWFNQKLPDPIELPGSCEQRGYGEKPGQPDSGRLTHVLTYVGPAWYQRDLIIPPQWTGKRVELFLERCHWETTVWVDGQRIGMQNSLSTPHLHNLGLLAPGQHTLTICVDNTYKIPIGTWAGAITEETQGNWNGIIGRIELRATDPVWVRDVQVFPAKIKVAVGNQTGQPVEATLQSRGISVPVGGGEFELPFNSSEKPWDEFAPQTHRLAVTLKAGAFSDTKTVSYGIRDLATSNKQFTVNGRPVLPRGPVDECIYPLTGYPPMDKAAWLRVLGICKSYGFNFMRFHSWCPPEAAFAAGDKDAKPVSFKKNVPSPQDWVLVFERSRD